MIRALLRSPGAISTLCLMLAVSACGAPESASSSGAGSLASAEAASADTAATAGATFPNDTGAGASTTGSPVCMNADIRDLFLEHLKSLDTLSAEQLQDITAALKSYDFGTNERMRRWRDDTVEAIEAGRLDAQYHTPTGAMIASGELVIAACS